MTPMLQHPSGLTNALNPNTTLQQLSAGGALQQLSANGQLQTNGLNTNSAQNTKNPPPANYVCHKCNVVGHWIQECPLNTQQQQDYTKPPPANYICHRCGIPGHWIKNCPTNGNPNFDNKPHLKVIKTSETGSIGNSTMGPASVSQQDGNTINSNEGASNGGVATASQPPSKKRRLNQM